MTRVLGIDFSPLGTKAVADLVTRPERPEGFHLLVTANLDHIAQLRVDPEFRDAYAAARIATIDGAPVSLYARLRGARHLERVTGSDLLPMIMKRLIPGVHRPFFVAPSSKTAVALRKQLVARGFAANDIGWIIPAYGFERNTARSASILDAIAGHRTTHLFMGVGAPKSENWMHRNRERLDGIHGFGFGAALDYAAGTRVRAPRFMQRLGLEWAFRVASEPRRLAKRYFVRSWGFLGAVWADLRGARKATGR